jgi:hypothetical protein
MAKSIAGLGKTLEVQASRPLDTFLDPPNKRIRIGVMLEDSSELHLWMTAEQFQQSLALLKLSAQKLGIQWP